MRSDLSFNQGLDHLWALVNAAQQRVVCRVIVPPSGQVPDASSSLGVLHSSVDTLQRVAESLSRCVTSNAVVPDILAVNFQQRLTPQITADIAREHGVSVTPCQHIHHYLGRSAPCVIYDASQGFQPNAFCAMSGALQAGGMLVFITPADARWVAEPDPDYERMLVYPYPLSSIQSRFIQRMIELINADSWRAIFDTTRQHWILPETLPVTAALCHQPEIQYSSDQQRVFVAIKHLLQQRASHDNEHCFLVEKGVVVITADRGRGKSAAIGAALAGAGNLVQVVTAPNKANVAVVLEHSGEAFKQLRLRYFPPDEILRHQPDADVLIIDEAAAIPESLVSELVRRYPRVILSSTVQGYEGSGRGFELRLLPALQRQFAAGASTSKQYFEQVTLSQPIRWGTGDVLEQLLNRCFLMATIDTASEATATDATATDATVDNAIGIAPTQHDDKHLEVEYVQQSRLLREPDLLRRIFSLLVYAHYRTRPSDLRDLMDGLNLHLWILKESDPPQNVLGVCVVAEEGRIDAEMIQQIYQGKRRPKGHLLPQVLCQGAGETHFAQCKVARVVRIAIDSTSQGRGLGSRLLRVVEQECQAQGFDYIGSSFAAYQPVLAFWTRNDYVPVRLGFSPDTNTGARAAVILKSLQEADSEMPVHCSILHGLSRNLRDELWLLLPSEYRDLEPDVISQLLLMTYQAIENINKESRGLVVPRNVLTELQQFVVGARTFGAIRAKLLVYLRDGICAEQFSRLDHDQKIIVIEHLGKGRALADVSKHHRLRNTHALSSKKHANTTLKLLVERLLT